MKVPIVMAVAQEEAAIIGSVRIARSGPRVNSKCICMRFSSKSVWFSQENVSGK